MLGDDDHRGAVAVFFERCVLVVAFAVLAVERLAYFRFESAVADAVDEDDALSFLVDVFVHYVFESGELDLEHLAVG